jgi:uncharacterized Zn-finger protein
LKPSKNKPIIGFINMAQILRHPELPDTFIADEHTVYCDGGGGALGHPKVYLELDHNGEITCPYCSRKFIRM